MSFTSLTFLTLFFPLAWLIWLACSKKTALGNTALLVLSMLFYGFGAWQNLVILLFMILFVYFGAMALQQCASEKMRKWNAIGTAAVIIGVFALYRYLPAFSSSLSETFQGFPSFGLMMPVGLSFYSFSLLSYYFDVYYRKVPVQKNLISLGLYAAFFGRVNMGPIGHYESFAPQLKRHPVTMQKMQQGAMLFVQGLFFKVMLADNFALVFAGLSDETSWLGNLGLGFSYFLQLFFDFAGYSRMARGMGCFFGFEIPRNFNKPYTAISVQDFWRRWHISLTDWFRNYVYIPLGGNRVSQKRWMFNLLVVWVLTGLWHGASLNFLLWGLWQAALILLEHQIGSKNLNRIPGVIRHLLVVVSQLIGWTLFFSASALSGVQIIGRYFGIGITGAVSEGALRVLSQSCILFAAGIWCACALPEQFSLLLCRRMPKAWGWIRLGFYALTFVLCLAMIISATSQSFLYAVF